MLLKSKTTVKLQKRYLKILFLSTALKDTFALVVMPSIGKEAVLHCDPHGKVLFERTFSHPVDAFAMPSSRHLLVAETRESRLSLLDLNTHEFSYSEHMFLREESDLVDLDVFYESRTVCVRESGQYNDNRFVLTYYNWPLAADSKAVARYESQDNEWTHEHLSRKANNHSMIVWFRPRNDEEIEIKCFDLRDNPKGSFRTYNIKNSVGEPYSLSKVEMAITNLWEARRNNFCMVTVSNKTENKALNKEGVVNNNFIVDVDAGTVREARFFFEQKYNDYLIDYLNLGPISMFRTFFFQDGKVETTPVYYVDNETEAVVARDEWQCTYKTKYYVPGFDSSTIIEGEY